MEEASSEYFGGLYDADGMNFVKVCDKFERALSNLNKMPRLWLMYLEFLFSNRSITRSRLTVNKCLQSLPITQHSRVWDIVINKFIGQNEFEVPLATCRRLFYRYIQFEPEYLDSYISFLLEKEEMTEAVIQLINLIEQKEENVTHSNFFRLVDLISKNANKIDSSQISVDLPLIIRSGLARFADEQGTLWVALADYYIRKGLFDKAVEIYEEGIDTVLTVSDFSIIFDSYQNFLQLLLTSKMEEDTNLEIERLELLIDRRDEMLSSVILRGNPNNVSEWIKRTKLPRIAQDDSLVVQTFRAAIATVDPLGGASLPVLGRVSSLWIEFGKYYLNMNDLKMFRATMNEAVHIGFKTVDELASVWIQWILLELTHNTDQEIVLETARRAISQYRGSPKGSVQANLFRSTKLWHLVLDIEESINGKIKPDLVRAIYEAMMGLKVITAQTILNYAQFEIDQGFFERAAKILEKGTCIFPWPHCHKLWLFYLQLSVQFRRKSKFFSTERVRDLFEQTLQNCPKDISADFYILFYKFESEFGQAANAIAVLRRAATTIKTPLDFYYVAIFEAQKLKGISAVREIFEAAISALSDPAHLIEMCTQYCQVEQQVGQTDRARSLLVHASQFAEPEKFEEFWHFWKNWELEFGDEETYKDMKRKQRAVTVAFSDKHYNTLDAGMEDERIETEQSIEVLPVESAPAVQGFDLSKLKQMAQLHKHGEFIPCLKFQGSKPGFVFTSGPKGTGYYPDT